MNDTDHEAGEVSQDQRSSMLIERLNRQREVSAEHGWAQSPDSAELLRQERDAGGPQPVREQRTTDYGESIVTLLAQWRERFRGRVFSDSTEILRELREGNGD